MAALSAFLPAVLIEVDQVPAPVAYAMIVRAAAEFCERGLVWSHIAPPALMVGETAAYVLDLPVDSRLVTVRALWQGTAKLIGADAPTIARDVPDWQNAIGSPSHYLMAELSPPTLRFYPTPGPAEDGKPFTAHLILAPSLAAATLPDFMAEKYRYEIAEGALAYLMALPNRAWSNPLRSEQLAQRFRMSISKARIQSEHGHVHNRPVVQSREFGY